MNIFERNAEATAARLNFQLDKTHAERQMEMFKRGMKDKNNSRKIRLICFFLFIAYRQIISNLSALLKVYEKT